MEYDALTPESLVRYRKRFADRDVTVAEFVDGLPIEVGEHAVPGPPGQPDVAVSVLSRAGSASTRRAAVYNIHGGGMFSGSRTGGLGVVLEHIVEDDLVVVSVEYRLAPEHPDPAPVEDCYAGLVWAASHAERLGVDPGRIVVMGSSAGGGLSAGVSLLARDRGGPALAGQGLLCPMLDERNATASSRQFLQLGVWPGEFNETGWDALLGRERRARGLVSPYAAPARADDLSGLPTAFVEVGAAEVFRDESVEYASRLWAAGTQAELHVWAGAFHGFHGIVPDAEVSRAAGAARSSWLRRVLGLS